MVGGVVEEKGTELPGGWQGFKSRPGYKGATFIRSHWYAVAPYNAFAVSQRHKGMGDLEQTVHGATWEELKKAVAAQVELYERMTKPQSK